VLLARAPLDPRYTFARFVVGPSNDAAVAAASAVAASPGRAYNPLVLHGETGLGKTHLMQAVAHAALADRASARVAYLSAEQFSHELVAAVQQGHVGRLADRYRQTDLLLVDDVHVLAGQPTAQASFAAVFTTLHEAGRQIMLTSDRPPQSIGLDAALVSRFRWGRIVDLSRPDADHRLAIVRAKLAAVPRAALVPDSVAVFVAEHVHGNVRVLEGALVRLIAHASLRGAPLTAAIAGDVLGVARPVDPATAVVRAVAAEWQDGVTPESLCAKRRTQALVEPRQVAMHVCRAELGMTLHDIGALFGGRDHSTVIHALDRVRARLAVDDAFAARVARVSARIAAHRSRPPAPADFGRGDVAHERPPGAP
jgi:chromosomal replication initiator protein